MMLQIANDNMKYTDIYCEINKVFMLRFEGWAGGGGGGGGGVKASAQRERFRNTGLPLVYQTKVEHLFTTCLPN